MQDEAVQAGTGGFGRLLFMLSGIDVEGIEDTYTSATVVSGEVEHDDSLFRSDEYKAYERRNVYNYQRLEEK